MTASIRNVADLYAELRASGLKPEELEAALAASDLQVAKRLGGIDHGLLRAVLRAGNHLEPIAQARAVISHLRAARPAPVFLPDVAECATMALPTNGELPEMPAYSDPAFDAWFKSQGVTYGLGLYGENRTVYATPQFADSASDERRTIHLGIDVFAPAGTPVHAPLDGRVHSLVYNADPLDYGHTLILEHQAEDLRFFTLYGHLGRSLDKLLRRGDRVVAGQHIAHLGDWDENGGWAPHLHFQIITDLLDQTGGNFFGVGHASLWDIWQQISPDPNLILRLPESAFRQ